MELEAAALLVGEQGLNMRAFAVMGEGGIQITQVGHQIERVLGWRLPDGQQADAADQARLLHRAEAAEPASGGTGMPAGGKARPGGGKSGGFRVLSLYPGEGYPVYLILVFGKNEKANVSAKEKKALKKAVDELIAAHEPKRKAVEK